jgi:competence protein ComEA
MLQRKNRIVSWTLALALISGALGAALAAVEEAPEVIKPPIDINSAGQDELMRLPGVGAETARRIVEFREQQGPFRRIEDLMKVKGIGEKTFEKLRPSIKISEKG